MTEKIIRSPTNPFGFVLRRGGEGRPGIIWLHGNGGMGDGSDGNLQNILTDGNIPEELLQAVEQKDLWLFAPQASNGWSGAEINTMFAYIATNNLTVDLTKMNGGGFSSGAGELIRWLSKSLENAKKIACAVIVAPTGVTPSKFIADAKVACWFHVNSGDTTCPPVNTNNAVNAINNFNPPVKAIKTEYNANDHGGQKEAFGLTRPSAPGGKGVTAPEITVYEWFEMNKQGSPVAVPQITGLVANAGQDRTVTKAQIELDGTGSSNYIKEKSGWELVGFPDGVNKWGVITAGGGWITAQATLPKAGNYTFRLKVTDSTGQTKTDDIIVAYSPDGTPPPPPPAVKEMSTITIDMTDKSVTVGFNDNSKVTIKKDGTQA